MHHNKYLRLTLQFQVSNGPVPFEKKIDRDSCDEHPRQVKNAASARWVFHHMTRDQLPDRVDIALKHFRYEDEGNIV